MAKKNRIWHYLVTIIVLIGLAAGGIKLRQKRLNELAHITPAPQTPWALHTVPVKKGVIAAGFPVLTTVTTNKEVTITPQISGTLTKMGPREGVKVKAGEILARIDTREIKENIASLHAQRKAAKAEETRMKNELAREEKLFKEGGSSASEVEARRTAEIAAHQQKHNIDRKIAALKVRKAYGVIRAPADGVIAERLAEPGDMAAPGHPIYRLTVKGGARIRAKLPQNILKQIHSGTPLLLHYGENRLQVRIDRVFPSLDATALGIVEADLPHVPFGLPSGARVAGRVILEELKDALYVPYGTLLYGPGRNRGHLFKIIKKNGSFYLDLLPVSIKLNGRNSIAVHGQLTEGDRVVLAHENVLLRLKTGDSVTVFKGGL